MGLAQAGADIVVVSRTAADCVNVAKEIEAMGKKAIAAPADISIVQGIEKLVSNVIKKIGKIDILVNNAAKGGHFPPFAYLFNNPYFIVLRLLSHASKSGWKANTNGYSGNTGSTSNITAHEGQ